LGVYHPLSQTILLVTSGFITKKRKKAKIERKDIGWRAGVSLEKMSLIF